MADILIRGMKMPRDCPMCILAHFSKLDDFTGCDAVPGKRYVPHSDEQFWNSAERPEWCPLVPLPEGHGRIVDAAEILEKANNSSWFDGDVAELGLLLGSEVTTIVPAEGGTDDG